MPYDNVDRSSVKEMIRAFYAAIMNDTLLEPVFSKALGPDITKGKWTEHFTTLDNFWLMMMTGERGYGGHPFPPHVFIGPLTREHFEHWMALFKETTSEYFIPEIAEKFYKKADVLADYFIKNLDIDGEDEDE